MYTLYLSLKMLWMGADTLSLKIKLVSSFIISVLRGVVSFFIPLSFAWLIKSFCTAPSLSSGKV